MKAWIVAIGSELLTPFRVDTNSLAITERLNAVGCDVRLKAVVGDDVEELVRVFKEAIGSVDLLVCTGGLGPTEDDLTRQALAKVLAVPLEVDESIVERIQSRFLRRGLSMPAINRRQAMVPRGASVVENPRGTAPGLWIERGTTGVLLLPGPPREMLPMLDAVVASRIAPKTGGSRLLRRMVRITGRTESDVDACVEPIYNRWIDAPVPIRTTILAVMGQIELHLSTAAGGAAEACLDNAVGELEAVLGSSVYSVDGRTLETVVGDLLKARGWTLAAAESCTGGLLLARLTDVPGSSAYIAGGVVCYSNDAKIELLGVPPALLAEHGAVSEPVAQAMAAGVRSRSRTNVGIGITGIAGPTGGTPEKPVGTVVLAIATDVENRVRTHAFIGDREQVRFQACQAAMNMLRLMLLSPRPSS
jgi:nicotinamide-nucleotide amidase